MKKLYILLILGMFLITGCSTIPLQSSKVNIRPDKDKELKDTKSVLIKEFLCHDSFLAQVIQKMIVSELLSTNIIIKNEGEADIVLEGMITLNNDRVFSSEGIVTANSYMTGGVTSSKGSEGLYISGITVQLIKNGEPLASATIEQSRTSQGIPSSPEFMGAWIGEEIRALLRKQFFRPYQGNR
jgi:hypothetical protein